MWLGKDPTQRRDEIFKDIMLEARNAQRTEPFGLRLRHKLELLPRNERTEIVNRVRDGYTPLFLAARSGAAEIVRYLIVHCGADIEKKGLYEVFYDHTTHYVTPLWCAAVVGHLDICKVLVAHNADVNAVSDSGSTAVRSACFMTNTAIVEFLVENGADINRANDNGGTCLINSVQSQQLCSFLLSKGADINARDSQLKTALHYAVQEDRLTTTKLLLEHGADYLAKSKHGDDALQTACLVGNVQIVTYLCETLPYSPERIADAYELLGALYLDDKRNLRKALDHWRTATRYRELHGIIKPRNTPKEVFGNVLAFETVDGLDAIAQDMDQLRMQSLIIYERVLGISHKDTVFRLMYRGAAYADSFQHQRCIDLWLYAISIRLADDSILNRETVASLHSVMKVMFDMRQKYQQSLILEVLSMKDVFAMLECCLDAIPAAQKVLEVTPVFRRHEEEWDRVLRILVLNIYIATVTAKTPEELNRVKSLIQRAVELKLKDTNGSTLLHIVCGRVESLRPNRMDFEEHVHYFPDATICRYLLRAGACVDAVNRDGSTPLHVASLRVNYREEIVRMLLKAGAHLDRTNLQGNQPLRMLGGNQECKIKLSDFMNLKCLAARKVKYFKIPHKGQVPVSLESFIQMH